MKTFSVAAYTWPRIETGWLMTIPIWMCSIILLILTLERLWAFHPGRFRHKRVLKETNNLKRGIKPVRLELSKVLVAHPCLLADLLDAAVALSGRPVHEVRDALRALAHRRLARLKIGNAWHSVIGRCGPMLGLLGSVIGISISIHAQSMDGSGRGPRLTAGFATALYSTGGGVLVALVGDLLASYFGHRLACLDEDIEYDLAGLPEKIALLDLHESTTAAERITTAGVAAVVTAKLVEKTASHRSLQIVHTNGTH